MRNLLIYNDNISSTLVNDFKERLGVVYKFEIGAQELLNPNFTIDGKIDSILKEAIESEKFDCIFLPYSLAIENYIEYIGLRIACHIRLTSEFGNKQTPIVFFGFESESEINKISDLGAILFSKGIFTTQKMSVNSFQNQIKYIRENYTREDESKFQKQFLRHLIIVPSGNYATHHSIANEWSIYRWAKVLNVDGDNIQRIEKTIGSHLYFKYLKAKYPIYEVVAAQNQIKLESGSILYIDDEIEKGWDTIFRKICTNKKYNSIGADFKNLTKNEIIQKSVQKIGTLNPDVVILDFRLHDDDFEITNPEEVTGYKILHEIKRINEGIQVIILSASNKIWNLLELQKAKADGFILKESPELSVDGNYSKKAIDNIYKSINEGFIRAGFLKKIWSDSNIIITQLNFLGEDSFKQELKNQLSLFWNLVSKAQTKTDFAYAYVSLYMIIEIMNKQFFEEISEECYWDEENKKYEFKPIERLSEWNKIAFLYFKKWGQTDNNFIQNLSYLIQKRNGFIHNDRKILDKKNIRGQYLNRDVYTKEGIKKLFESIYQILGYLQ